MHPRLRSFAFGTLLLVLPLSGIRVICIESPAQDGYPAAPAAHSETATEARPLTDCERLCPFHPPESMPAADADAAATTSDEDADCALSSETAALQMLGTIAVLRSAPSVALPDVVSDAPGFTSSAYDEPSLALLAPPPKPTVL